MTTQNIFDMADTWNAGGTTFTSIKMNVTDTASAEASLLMDLQVGGVSKFSVTKAGAATLATVGFSNAVASYPNVSLGTQSGWGLHLASTSRINWTQSGDYTTTKDLSLVRVAAGILGVRGGSDASAGGVLSLIEQTAPSAPSANGCYIYAQDNGAGKTQLMALFASGAAQQIAIEP